MDYSVAYYGILAFCILVILGGLIHAFFPSRRPQLVQASVEEDFPGIAGDFPVFPEDFKPAVREKFSSVVGYKSRRHGNRLGVELGRDNSGRMIIHLDGHPSGVTVRRQPHLVRRAQLL
ncbi:MAG: hypothetical protein HYT03_01475 [Candidatus Harrisonbacteria bacterium]|nr:hypothetical protein [Candidatus Harrisonbacteria bacterium]